MKQINTKEELFFGDDPSIAQLTRQFGRQMVTENRHLFLEILIEKERIKDQDGNFVNHTKFGIFKSQQGAREYFNYITNSLEPIRLASRKWNQEHQILSKAVIIDLSDNTTISLLDCLENVCERFGGVCNETNGCSTVPFAKEYKNKKQFSIKLDQL